MSENARAIYCSSYATWRRGEVGVMRDNGGGIPGQIKIHAGDITLFFRGPASSVAPGDAQSRSPRSE